jgi:hypothetical protein
MKSTSNWKLIALMVFIAALAPQALTAGEIQCPRGNAPLRGTYMSHGTGTVVGLGPIATVGLNTYDGKGNLVNTYTVSVNGVIRSATVTGTYTVNGDCTGTVTLENLNYYFVVAPDGSKSFWIENEPTTVFSGSVVRLGHADSD